jgi:hypothetical protein
MSEPFVSRPDTGRLIAADRVGERLNNGMIFHTVYSNNTIRINKKRT